MKWIIVHSPEQTGLTGLASALAERLDAYVLDVDEPGAGWPSGMFDAVLLVNGMKWFMHNRLSVPGRPWICAASFCFEDLRHLIELNTSMADTGVNVLFSNCAEFVRHVSAAMSAKFCWMPLAGRGTVSTAGGPMKVGTVLPNVLDRDLSQALHTCRIFRDLGEERRFVVYTRRDEKMRLPEELQAAKKWYSDIAAAFNDLRYFVPAPRISDYRVGIVPSEVVWAAQCGCAPLLIHHPLMEVLEHSGFTMERSMRSYEVTVNMIANNADLPMTKVEMPEHMRFTADQFADEVQTAYARWRANARA